jgi:hypothetical protein
VRSAEFQATGHVLLDFPPFRRLVACGAQDKIIGDRHGCVHRRRWTRRDDGGAICTGPAGRCLSALFGWQVASQQCFSLTPIQHQPPVTSQPTVFFSHNESVSATSHQSAERGVFPFPPSVPSLRPSFSFSVRTPEGYQRDRYCNRCTVTKSVLTSITPPIPLRPVSIARPVSSSQGGRRAELVNVV